MTDILVDTGYKPVTPIGAKEVAQAPAPRPTISAGPTGYTTGALASLTSPTGGMT